MMEVNRTIFGRPKLKMPSMTDHIIRILTFAFLLISVYTIFFRIEYKWDSFSLDAAIRIATNFFRFDLVSTENKVEMLYSLLNTLGLGFVTTVLGMVVGIILGLLAARNISNDYLANIIRGLASFVRAVPTIIWVLIFVAGYGLTATTAVVGMFFHTMAFFTKSFAEAFEEVESGTIEALKATGSNWFQIVFGTILPSSLTKMISWLAIRNEINFAVAVVIGPATGVPGTIGTAINNAARAGEYPIQGFGVFLVFLTAFVMETAINYIRRRSIAE